MENFLNCPDLSKASNCLKIKELMKNCNESNYSMLHHFFFEEIYYKSHENVTLKWTTRTTTLGTPYPTEMTTEEATTDESTTTVESESTEATELVTKQAVTKKVIQVPTNPITIANSRPKFTASF
jgi:hypothetical protein